MAMLEKHRNVIYHHVLPQIGEEATQAMLANFPARDIEEPVTREHLARSTATLRSEIQGVRTEIQEVRIEIQSVRAELRGEIDGLRTEIQGVRAELRGEIDGLRTELRAEIHEVRLSVEQLRSEMQRLLNRQLVVMVSVVGVAVGVVLRAG